jgi:hypothetical protein
MHQAFRGITLPRSDTEEYLYRIEAADKSQSDTDFYGS